MKTIKISDDLHYKLKLESVQNKISLQDLILNKLTEGKSENQEL